MEDLLKDDEKPGQSTIFEKNKWIKRMDTLNSEGIRETIESQYDGADTFSPEFILAN